MDLIDDKADPFDLFETWFAQAEESEPEDHNAMTVTSVSDSGMPSARILLLKGRSPKGFVFYTNFNSQKGKELQAHPKCALLFHWKSVRRQIRIQGPVEEVQGDEADAYFASRARTSQIGAWASDQSSPMPGRDTFEERIAEFEEKFDGQDVPRPPNWSGFRVVPAMMEFWQDRQYRLHDRVRFTRPTITQAWSGQRLYP